MLVKIKVNGKLIQDDVQPQTLLLDWLRDRGCYSVKRGCDTANCGLCTVLRDGTPILSCSTLTVRCDGREITTLEGLQKEAGDPARQVHLVHPDRRGAVLRLGCTMWFLFARIYYECFGNGKRISESK